MRSRLLWPAVAFVAAAGGAAASGPPSGRAQRLDRAHSHQVRVPAGTFTMGVTSDEREELERICIQQLEFIAAGRVCAHYMTELEHMAPRRVFVSEFWIDRDEVSVADYRACVAGGGCQLDPLISGDARYLVPTWPIVNVTWSEASDYCRWRGGRLPSEAEWERAARGDDDGRYPWGDAKRSEDFNHGRPPTALERELDRSENIDLYIGGTDASDGAEFLAPVGSYKWGEGPYGTRDQAGNAAEWTADAYLDNDTTNQHGYDDLPPVDPLRRGLLIEGRVVRGGSWRQPEVVSRSNVRDPYQIVLRADRRYPYIGFRCVQPVRGVD